MRTVARTRPPPSMQSGYVKPYRSEVQTLFFSV
jgi:hypothetical protein